MDLAGPAAATPRASWSRQPRRRCTPPARAPWTPTATSSTTATSPGRRPRRWTTSRRCSPQAGMTLADVVRYDIHATDLQDYFMSGGHEQVAKRFAQAGNIPAGGIATAGAGPRRTRHGSRDHRDRLPLSPSFPYETVTSRALQSTGSAGFPRDRGKPPRSLRSRPSCAAAAGGRRGRAGPGRARAPRPARAGSARGLQAAQASGWSLPDLAAVVPVVEGPRRLGVRREHAGPVDAVRHHLEQRVVVRRHLPVEVLGGQGQPQPPGVGTVVLGRSGRPRRRRARSRGSTSAG